MGIIALIIVLWAVSSYLEYEVGFALCILGQDVEVMLPTLSGTLQTILMIFALGIITLDVIDRMPNTKQKIKKIWGFIRGVKQIDTG